jgi:hypothetical protein
MPLMSRRGIGPGKIGQDKEAGAEGNRRTLSPVRGVAQAAAGAAFGSAALRAVAPSGDVLAFTRE